MNPRNMHVLLICTKLRRPGPELTGLPEITRLSVITEHGHVHRYAPGVSVHTVDDIREFDAVRRAVLDVAREQPVDAVLGPYEYSLPVSGYVRDYLGLPGLGHAASLGFADKYAMKRRLAAAGLPTAAHRRVFRLDAVARAADAVGWPCVVKPVFGGGSKDVVVLRSPADLDRFAASPEAAGLRDAACPLIVEAYVPLDAEYHCDGVVWDGEVRFAAASRYFSPVLTHAHAPVGSYVLPEDDPEADVLLDLHRRAVSALGLEAGVTHMEAFRTPDGFVIGEIACRPAGGGLPTALRLQFGVDLWHACARTSLGLAPGLAPVRRPGIVANCHLPVRPGRIVRLTPPAELLALPGVLQVDMQRTVGDVVPDELFSATAAGIVYFEAADGAEARARYQAVADRYEIRTAEPAAV